jgi:hypothetical protein
VDELEHLLDQLAALLDCAHLQALQDPTQPGLPDRIRREWEHVKLIVRRIEKDLSPLEPD